MIFEQLNTLKIPYIVLKHKQVSLINEEVGCYRYEIFLDYDIRLRRLGFNVEKEIRGKERAYMYRVLTPGEVRLFRSFNCAPCYKNKHITIWEFNGRIKRYMHPKARRDGKGRFVSKPWPTGRVFLHTRRRTPQNRSVLGCIFVQ